MSREESRLGFASMVNLLACPRLPGILRRRRPHQCLKSATLALDPLDKWQAGRIARSVSRKGASPLRDPRCPVLSSGMCEDDISTAYAASGANIREAWQARVLETQRSGWANDRIAAEVGVTTRAVQRDCRQVSDGSNEKEGRCRG